MLTVLQLLQEDWDLDLKRNSSKTGTHITELMKIRQKQGLVLFDPKPEGIEAVPYAVFFDSMFELADAWVSETGALCY